MKVLIVTYYWPPAGGSGVQRWLKFVKYLQDFGIEPVVYTPKNARYTIKDFSLEEEVPKNVKVIQKSIFEPNTILSVFKGKSSKQSAGFLNPNPSFFGKIVQQIRANYFIPDARKYWVNPSVKFLKKYLLTHKIDAVITTGPPHSMHLIGLELKKATGINWISDFRDPWTEIDYFHQLPLSNKSREKHHQLEKEVLKLSDAVLVVGNTMKEKYLKFSKKVHVITNGFDSSLDVKNNPVLDKKFSITHVGLMNADRNPLVLWKAIAEICKENKQFEKDVEIKLIGKIAVEVENDIEKLKLKNYLKIDYLPHNEVKMYQQKSQVLLLAINNVPSAKGILTGKIFEYLQAKRPILAIGPPDGDLAEILKKTNAGIVVDFNDTEKLKTEILRLYSDYKKGSLSVLSKNISEYHRKNLTGKLSKIIKEIGVKN